MSAPLEAQASLPWTSYAADSPVRTCPARERARALLANARACGVSTLALSASSGPLGLWLRTSPAAQLNGSTRSSVSWTHSAMRAFRAQCRRAMSALLTAEGACLLLPTLTVCQRYNRGGEPSLQTLARAALLPTLSTNPAPYNTRRGVKYPGLLPTLLASHPEALRDRRGRKHESMLPTLTARDEKGPGSAKKSRGGKGLPLTLGGHLSPAFCLWFMGFPADWLDVDDAPAFARSATRSSRSAPKSSAG
jgi:hypothetical protein